MPQPLRAKLQIDLRRLIFSDSISIHFMVCGGKLFALRSALLHTKPTTLRMDLFINSPTRT
jgi:hypothetical protein